MKHGVMDGVLGMALGMLIPWLLAVVFWPETSHETVWGQMVTGMFTGAVVAGVVHWRIHSMVRRMPSSRDTVSR